ncbi:MAG: hypothetical protein AB7L66_23285 [Gemmatimonadales bacterium]
MTKRPLLRLLLLVFLVGSGLALYFWLAPRTPVIVRPAATELMQ